jgi:hypothetical protein
MVVNMSLGDLRLFFSALLASSRERQGVPENIVEDAYLAEMLIRFVQPTPETMESLEKPLLSALYEAPKKQSSGKAIRELAEAFFYWDVILNGFLDLESDWIHMWVLQNRHTLSYPFAQVFRILFCEYFSHLLKTSRRWRAC